MVPNAALWMKMSSWPTSVLMRLPSARMFLSSRTSACMTQTLRPSARISSAVPSAVAESDL